MGSGVLNQASKCDKVHSTRSFTDKKKMMIEHTVGKFSEMLFARAFKITRIQDPLSTRIKFSFDLTAGDCPFTHRMCLYPVNGN